MQFTKKEAGNRISFISVTYEGILTVTDKELFVKALTEGIGREKAYGMGMLTVMRLQFWKKGARYFFQIYVYEKISETALK